LLTDSRVLIMGMGRSGVSAAKYAISQGAQVTVTDSRRDAPQVEGAKHTYGEHIRSDFTQADLVIVSPGIPASAPDIVAAREAGVAVVSELGFAAERIQALGIPLIAVTGTNGKSSVTWFIGQLLEAAGHTVFVGGNFGTALSDLLATGDLPDFAVVEVSSYQLELPGRLAPTAAVCLNLAPDHLARHGTLENYGRTKVGLFASMSPSSIAAVPRNPAANPDGILTHGDTQAQRLWLDGEPGLSRTQSIVTLTGTPDDGTIDLSSLRLLGEHNRDNVAAAALMCVAVGVPRSKIDVSCLTALPHRLQPVLESNGVTWVNDSKATNVDAAIVGIGGIERPLIVLLGGAGKPGADYGRLQASLQDNTRRVICFGDAGDEIAKALCATNVDRVSTLSDAVHAAARLAEAPDVVLLSPACASFDEFNNFEERGAAFAALAKEVSQ
jgi:UDP-N-acetylmuramoylalanine--D-glutamate ligase